MKTRAWVFVLPWIFGLAIFTLYPFGASFFYSFTDYSVLREPTWLGLENFQELMSDQLFWISLKNSIIFAALAIPTGMVLAIAFAKALNMPVKGSSAYRAIVYIPNLIPTVASAILWMWIFNPEMGLINETFGFIFSAFGLKPPTFLGEERLFGIDLADQQVIFGALPSLVLMALWSVGQMTIIYLAKLQDVPQSLYEAAELDGAGWWSVFVNVELPQVSPLILFNVIMGIIGTFQVFTEPYIMTNGGPNNATYLLPMFIYDYAFEYLRMGYACAAAWILFGLIAVLTVTAYRIGQKRVYYEGA